MDASVLEDVKDIVFIDIKGTSPTTKRLCQSAEVVTPRKTDEENFVSSGQYSTTHGFGVNGC